MTVQEFIQRQYQLGERRADVARRIVCDSAYVGRWANGDVPSPYWCARIADAYGLPRAEVLHMAGHYDLEATATTPVDVERNQTLRELGEVLDETPRASWLALVAILRGAAPFVAQSMTNVTDASQTEAATLTQLRSDHARRRRRAAPQPVG